MPIIPPTPYVGSVGDGMLYAVARQYAKPEETVAIGADCLDGTYGPPNWLTEPIHRIVSASWSEAWNNHCLVQLEQLIKTHNTQVFMRDKYSQQRLLKLLPDATNNIHLSADLAFLAADLYRPVVAIKAARTLAIIPKTQLDQRLAVELIGQGYKLLVIQHDLRTGPLYKQLNPELRQAHATGQVMFYVPRNMDCYPQVQDLLRSCCGVISGRLHGCISAMSVGVPTMMLQEYNNKAEGVFAQFDLAQYVCLQDTDIPFIVAKFLVTLPAIREKIAENLPRVKATALASLQQTF